MHYYPKIIFTVIAYIIIINHILIAESAPGTNKLKLKYVVMVIENNGAEFYKTSRNEMYLRPDTRVAVFEINTEIIKESKDGMIIKVLFSLLCEVRNGKSFRHSRIPTNGTWVLVMIDSQGQYLGFVADLLKSKQIEMGNLQTDKSDRKNEEKIFDLAAKNEMNILLEKMFIAKQDKISKLKYELKGATCEKRNRKNTEIYYATRLKRILRTEFKEEKKLSKKTINTHIIIECSKDSVFQYYAQLRKKIGERKKNDIE